MQLITSLALFNTRMPANAFIFNVVAFQIVRFSMIPPGGDLLDAETEKQKEPYNE